MVNNNKTRKTIHLTYINTGEEQFEQVNSFKFLESVVNTDRCIEEQIKEGIAARNRAYRVHKKKTIFIKINIPKSPTTPLQHVNSPNSNLRLRNGGG